MEKVDVYLQICGDYVAFHEISASVVYDVTNNIQLDEYTLEEIEAMVGNSDYCDVEMVSAIKDGDEYYYKL